MLAEGMYDFTAEIHMIYGRVFDLIRIISSSLVITPFEIRRLIRPSMTFFWDSSDEGADSYRPSSVSFRTSLNRHVRSLFPFVINCAYPS